MGINIYINENDERIKCLLLARFELEREVWQTKKFLCFKKQILSKQFVKSALIFIPWQYRQKEMRIVRSDEIIAENNSTDNEFVQIENFVSPYKEEYPYLCEFRIRNFCGYGFIYDYPDFIANVYQQDDYKSYELLYKNKPELLSLSNGR